MKYARNILETIGNTPLVKLNKVIEDVEALVLAKIETFNPGNSPVILSLSICFDISTRSTIVSSVFQRKDFVRRSYPVISQLSQLS